MSLEKNIIIIGNGFDLSLGLSTSYCDFINSNYFTDLISKNNQVCNLIKIRQQNSNWIDIENTLKIISKFAQGNILSDFQELCMALKNYISQLDYSKINYTSIGVKFLGNLIEKEYKILDYNYTDATKRVLESLGVDNAEINERLIKVHGSIEENDIIFGVEDTADIKSQDVFLKKSFNKCYKAIDLNRIMENGCRLFIFGHSLGETDHTYFSKFFLNKSNNYERTHITLHYYGHQSYIDLMRQLYLLTNNQVAHLKQNNLFKMVDSFK